MQGVAVERPKKSREERGAGRAVLCIFGVLFLTWGAYIAVVAALLLGQYPWLIVHLQPLDKKLATLAGFVLIPLCLLLTLSRRTRLLSGMGFFFVSGVFTFVTSASCAVYVYNYWPHWTMVLGSLMVGYGIMPTAALCAGAQNSWEDVGKIASGGIMLFSCLYLGLTLMTLSFSAEPIPHPPGPEDGDE